MSKYIKLAEEWESPNYQPTLNDRTRKTRRKTLAGRLAAQVAHDLNNPLQGVILYSELGQSELPADSPIQEYLAGIEECAEQLQKLATQLRAFADQEIDP